MIPQKQSDSLYLNASYLLVFCMLLLPLHTQLFYMVLPIYTHISKEIISIWKELLFILVFTIFVIDFLLHGLSPKILSIDPVLITFLIFLVFLVFMSDDRWEAFYGFRVFTEPLMVYYLARNAQLSLKAVNTLFSTMFFVGVIIGAWGIFQASILGDNFLIDLGYESSNGRLNSSYYIAMFLFQRAVGTFSSPNTFGIYLQMCIMLGVYLNSRGLIKHPKIYYLSNFILVGALLYTFSRSSLLALAISITMFTSLNYGFKKCVQITSKVILVFFIVFLVFFAFNKDVMEPLITHSINTITLQDPSAVGHLDSFNDSVTFASKNPFGIGLGKSGPRASARSGLFINSENSFFIILFDLGLLGLFFYLFMLCLFMYYLYSKIRSPFSCESKALIILILSTFAGQILVWNLLPYIVELETTLILFFILGLGFNKHINQTNMREVVVA